MYKSSNALRKIDENKIIKVKKNNKRLKSGLLNFIFISCIFSITLFIFIFLFNRAKSSEFAYKNFENHDENFETSENFCVKDTKNFECTSYATEDKIIIL